MKKIFFNQSKVIRLENVFGVKMSINEEENTFNRKIEQMQSYIKVKGAMQVGPLIQYTKPFLSEDGEVGIEIVLMLQTNIFIHSVEQPYSMESVLRIPNCMYCKYIGPEDKLKFAYDKINLEAFENDIELIGESYTVFVDRNEEEETIIADVFMPRVD